MRWPSSRRTAAIALLTAVITTVAGCSSTEPPPAPEPDADPLPTTLESYDTAGVNVVRGPFCDRVSPTGVEPRWRTCRPTARAG